LAKESETKSTSDLEPVSHRLVRDLEDAIHRGDYKAGTVLPSQRALSAEFGVSRSSLREALSVMETLGLVSSEAGQRTRVLGASHGKASVRWRYASRYTEKDVYELRLLLESRAARLAAAKITGQTLADLAGCVAAMKDAIRRGDLLTAALKDFDFHGIVVTLSGNRLFKEIHDMDREAILESQRLPLSRHNKLWEPVEEHERILQAFEHRDPDGAAYLMSLHIIRAAERIGIHLKP